MSSKDSDELQLLLRKAKDTVAMLEDMHRSEAEGGVPRFSPEVDLVSTDPLEVGTQLPKGRIMVLASGLQKGSGGKGKGRRGGDRMITRMVKCPRFPPAFDAIPTYTVIRRFVSAESVAATSLGFAIRNGHQQFLMATDTSTLYPIVDTWRIKRISVWTINYVDNATTATLYPVGVDLDTNNFNDRERAFSCSSRSEAEPGRMTIVPARDTPLGGWHKSSTVNSGANLFIFNVDYGGASSGNWATVTMDIEFEFVLNTFGAAQGYTSTVAATATLGTMYGRNWPSTSPAMLLQSVNAI